MDLAAGLIKLNRVIKSKNDLIKKLKTMPDNQVIKDTIEEHKKTIIYLKKELKFDEIFEVAGIQEPDFSNCPVCKAREKEKEEKKKFKKGKRNEKTS